MQEYKFKPIGYVITKADTLPRHWSISDVEGESEKLIQKPPHLNEKRGVFSTCSPHRPNPIGLSVLEVIDVVDNIIKVRRLDIYDGTPVFDIKPYI